jgi:very-short-patch-repair endonuclease
VSGGGLSKNEGVTILANENARTLRKRLTPQEVKLWIKLRELKTLGFHFRRQAPIDRYIVDFVSFRSRLVIEADGGQHGMPAGVQADQVRDAFLLSQGFRVLRFWNSDIDDNLAGVVESVLNALNQPPPRPPADPPHKGEGIRTMNFARLGPTRRREN